MRNDFEFYILEENLIRSNSKINSDLQLIKEGDTKLWIGKTNNDKSIQDRGPGFAKVPFFFNHAMEFSRDISILVLENFIKERINAEAKRIRILDGLAGIGARGVRIETEISELEKIESEIVINDLNPLAFGIIKKNIEQNNLQISEATNFDLNSLLVRNRFDYIDIDPFGSPVKFLDSGTRMLYDNGVLAVTATDTATLYGTYPKTCLRRYDAYSCRTPFSHELGPRILIGTCVRIGAKHNIGLFPILTHSTDYYYRVYLRGLRGRKMADSALANLGFIFRKDKSNYYFSVERKELLNFRVEQPEIIKSCFGKVPKLKVAGPLWLGQLYDISCLNRLDIGTHKFGTKKEILKNISIWKEEAITPPGFYNANYIASELKISTPPLNKIIKTLAQHGFLATKTHFSVNSFKTDAPFSDIMNLIKEI